MPKHTGYKRKDSAIELVRKQLRQAPGSLIRATDLGGCPPTAVSKALARLADRGEIRRLRKGVYYVPKATLLGESRPTEPAMVQKVLGHRARPTGVTAANLLGLTTQLAGRPEYAAYAVAVPSGLESARLRMRPRSCAVELDARDAALLEVLRDRGRDSELSAEDTCARVQSILRGDGDACPGTMTPRRLQGLRDAALLEPPRVRAILGALMSAAGLPSPLWKPLRASLNPFSRFDFGLFRELPDAKEWQAK
jgi:hypothetical protein